jgi:hypothetical protein
LFTFFLAILSWHFIEKPFRKKGVVSKTLFLYSMITVATIFIIFGYSAHKTHGFPLRVFDNTSKPDEMHISYNMRNFEFKRETFKKSSNFRILVLGDSKARDLINVIRETYDMEKIDLVYRDDVSSCIISELGKKLFIESDLVIRVSFNVAGKNYRCLLEKSNEINKQVLFIGPVNFGYNLNWITRIKKNNRALLRNQLSKETIKAEEMIKNIVPKKNYISIIDVLADKSKHIIITDGQGKLISPDRMHLTRYGAIYLGKNLTIPPLNVITKLSDHSQN